MILLLVLINITANFANQYLLDSFLPDTNCTWTVPRERKEPGEEMAVLNSDMEVFQVK